MEQQINTRSRTYITPLREAAMQLFNSLHNMSPEDETFFVQTIRKLFLYELYSDDFIIAVSGIQGTGKSTVANRIYDHDHFPVLRGRGETIPIIVRERSEITGPADARYYAHTLRKDTTSWTIEKCRIDKEEFQKLSITPTARCLHLEAELPMTLQLGPKMALLVLPGKQNITGNLWQTLLESAIATSSQHIVVVNYFQLREGGNTRMFDAVREHLGEQQPIMIITHMDETGYSVEDARNDVVQRFEGLRPESVFFTGQFEGDEERDAELRDWLIGKLLDEGYITRKAQGFFSDLRTTIQYDIEKFLSQANDLIRKMQRPVDRRFDILESYINAFDEEAKRIKDRVSIHIMDRLANRHADAVKMAKDEQFRKFNERLLPRIGKIFGAGELPDELLEVIQGLWNNSSELGPSEECRAIIRNATKELSGVQYDEKHSEQLPALLGTDEATLSAMSYLMSMRTSTSVDTAKVVPDEIMKAVRMSPYIALVLMSYGTYLRLENLTGSMSPDVSSTTLAAVLEESKEDIAKTLGAAVGTLKYVGMYIGLDVLPDGKLDMSIPAFATGLQKVLGLSDGFTAILQGALSWALIVLPAITMISSFLRGAAKDEGERRAQILSILSAIRAEVEKELNNRLSTILAGLRDEIQYLLARSLNYEGGMNQIFIAESRRNTLEEIRRRALNNMEV